MDNEQFERAIGQAIIAAQGPAMAAFYIARELLVDVARLQPKPEQYLAQIFDRVSARLDPQNDQPEKGALSFAREMVEVAFRDASKALAHPQSPRDGGNPRR